MQLFYKRFDLLLYIFILLSIAGTIISAIGAYYVSNVTVLIENKIVTFTWTLFGISLFFGCLYVVAGIPLMIIYRNGKKKAIGAFGKSLFFKGLGRSIVSLLFFFILGQSLVFAGLVTSAIALPHSSQSGLSVGVGGATNNFPSKDLHITNTKVIPASSDASEDYCEITIKNVNPSLTATYVTLNQNDESDVYATGDKRIGPRQSLTFAFDSDFPESPCENLSISEVGIAPRNQ
ncbi:MAG TPA: hypothetical protein VLF93_06550 [Candidatus Saccharimonadales bacterium]|nr:hypothetical protein [Candidatus Saccharimonadales bacterium]